MNYLVTGGLGFIGSNIVKLLVEKGHNVTIIDNCHTGNKDKICEIIEKVKIFQVDIRDKQKLENIIKDFDGIFHEAALTAVPESFEKPEEYKDVNVNGTKNIFELALREKIPVVYASSSSIYGNVKTIPINEKIDKNPINPYGQTKVDKETLAEDFVKQGLSVIGLRYFNVYGIGQTGSYAGVITKFLDNIKKKKSFVINGNGNQVRDFIHVSDIANANLAIMESEITNGFFNVGTGIKTSINDLAEIMIKQSNQNLGIIHDKQLEGDVEISQADTTLLERSFNWHYKIELKQGLQQLIQNI